MIDFEQFADTLHNALYDVSGEILLSQHDLSEHASYARISRLKAINGNVYALIQIEGYAARTEDDSKESINQAVLALSEISGAGRFLEQIRQAAQQANAGGLNRLH